MVDIVIVNWNSGDYLQLCLRSILCTDNKNYIGKIVIVDNASSDHSMENLAFSDEVMIIRNNENLGFSKACNQGFKKCSSGYVLLLNPDARLTNTTLQGCITFMDSRKEIDILGCQLLDDEGEVTHSCSRFPTPVRYFYDATGLSKLTPKIFTPALLMTDWDHKNSRKVDQVMGAFMFMRRNLFERIGYFDERFFVYYEELDFSKRLRGAGGISFFNSEIKAVHSGQGTTKNIKSYRLFLNLNSRLLYAKKHFNRFSYFFVKWCTFVIEPFSRSFFLLLQGQTNKIKNVWKGYSLLLRRKKLKPIGN